MPRAVPPAAREITWNLGQNAALALRISPRAARRRFIIGFRAAAVMVVGGFPHGARALPLVTKAWASGAAAALAVGDRAEGDRGLPRRGAGAAALAGPEPARTISCLRGRGAVGAAGLLTVARTGPTMVRSLAAVARGLARRGRARAAERTTATSPGWMLVAGIAAVVCLLAFVPGVLAGELASAALLAALGASFFAFLFVPVSSRMVGVIGVSSNPTSAMALVTLAGTAGVFALLGWKALDARAAVLTVGTVVCVAASKAGDISQDLKTGQLVGATPALQQYGQLVAAAVACWASRRSCRDRSTARASARAACRRRRRA
jgi:uncharacterized oligopeptide transporter (OPT) family protein